MFSTLARHLSTPLRSFVPVAICAHTQHEHPVLHNWLIASRRNISKSDRVAQMQVARWVGQKWCAWQEAENISATMENVEEWLENMPSSLVVDASLNATCCTCAFDGTQGCGERVARLATPWRPSTPQ